MREINASIPFDKALWRQDIAASKAHAAMLGALRDRSRREDAKAIEHGLDQVAAEYERDGVPEDWALEDIHMTVESRLAELIGPAAGRLHTARSRNDQVATDFRLWVRDAIDQADAGLEALQRALVDARRRARRQHHARLHPPADRAAGHARPSPDGLLRDGRARPLALRRRARAAQPVPARQRGARRHRLSDRPRDDRAGARLRRADRQQPRRRLRPRLRARLPAWPPRSARCTCRASPRN